MNKVTSLDQALLITVLITIILSGIYFYILLDVSSELFQVRRILLGSHIIVLAGLTSVFILLKLRRISFAWIKNKGNAMLTVTIVVIIVSVAGTFQMRLPDAFRHAYASAFLTYYTSVGVAEILGNLVEWVTSYKTNNLFNSGMDQCNNYAGRQIALNIKEEQDSWRAVESKINTAYKNGDLILSKNQHQDILTCYKTFFTREISLIEKMQAHLATNAQSTAAMKK